MFALLSARLLGGEEECPICHKDYVEDPVFVVTECGHKFHKSCLAEWLTKYGDNCPMCRTRLREWWDTTFAFPDSDSDADPPPPVLEPLPAREFPDSDSDEDNYPPHWGRRDRGIPGRAGVPNPAR